MEITEERKHRRRVAHTITIEPEADIDDCTIRAKVIIDGVEYSAFYDTCNLILRDKNGKVADLDSTIEGYVMDDLDNWIGVDFD